MLTNLGTKCKQWYLHSDTWIFINWIWIVTRIRDHQIGETGSGNSAILRQNLANKKTVSTPPIETKAAVSFLMPQGDLCLIPKIVNHQTTPILFVKNEYLMAKIDVYCSLLPIATTWSGGWVRHKNDITSEFKCKFYKHLELPNLAMIAIFDKIIKIGGYTQLHDQDVSLRGSE